MALGRPPGHQHTRLTGICWVSHVDRGVVNGDTDNARSIVSVQGLSNVVADADAVQVGPPHGLAIPNESFQMQSETSDPAVGADTHGCEVAQVCERQGEQVIGSHGLSVKCRHGSQHVRKGLGNGTPNRVTDGSTSLELPSFFIWSAVRWSHRKHCL